MPDPREVYEHPEDHWSFLTAREDADFEGQYFDRKEAGRVKSNGFVDKNTLDKIIDEITECISAFANINKVGSLLVLGISKIGEIKGICHLKVEQRNRLTSISGMLSNQAVKVKFFDCQNDSNARDKICLVYVPYTEHAICETPASLPKAWLRHGAQNILMSQQQREQLQRDKGIIDFEQTYCCPFDSAELDQAVLKEFRDSYFSQQSMIDDAYDTEELLYQIGALMKHEQRYAFTNAGFLFFASNPQRRLTAAYIQLLRFDTDVGNIENRGLPTFERSFSGPITKQIRDMRTFFRESGFFKVYHYRNPEGGFLEEPEY